MGVQRWASLHMIAWACMILYGLSHFVSTKKKKKNEVQRCTVSVCILLKKNYWISNSFLFFILFLFF